MGVKYSFSDTETSGMLENRGHEQRYEQIYQLGIVAADENFNTVEAHNIAAKRKANIVGNAGAHATTGVGPREADKPKTTEYDMARTMTRYIERHPATVWMYWNMDFDTPNKRQMMFRSLSTTLATTSNGNIKADGLRIAKAAYCFNPDTGIAFPEGYQGKPSLKLGNMCKENGEPLSGAHDAVNDADALRRLCKVMAAKDKRTWAHMINMATKQGVDSFLQANPVFLWTPPHAYTYNTSAFCKVAHKGEALISGNSPNLKQTHNEIIIANLAVDPETWRHLDDRALMLVMKGRNPDNPRQSLGWNEKPFEILKRNGQPVIWPYEPDPVALPPGESGVSVEGRRRVSNLRDVRLMDLSPEELERRRKLIQEDRSLCDRLSIIADNMWKHWDDEKQMWVERDTGPKLLEDRVYDDVGLNMPQQQKRELRKLIQWFHDRTAAGRWDACEELVDAMGNLFPKPDPALKQADKAKYEQHMLWRDYTTTMRRFGILILFEQERAHDCEWAYLRNPANRYWAEQFVYQRLTEPSKDSKGEPLEKPKYRTIDDAVRLANDDLARYEKQLETRRRNNNLPPEVAQEYEDRIRMTEECLQYYEDLRVQLVFPERRVPPASLPARSQPANPPQQYHMPDDHKPLDHIPRPAQTSINDFDSSPQPAARKKQNKPAKTLPPGPDAATAAFKKATRRSPTAALNAQSKRKQPVVKKTPEALKAKAKAPPPPKRGRGPH